MSDKKELELLRYRVRKINKALKPFADCVYNDNGSMTVDSSMAKYNHFCDAYMVYDKDNK